MAYETQPVDETNRRILEALQADARLSMAELGRRVSLSPPAVAETPIFWPRRSATWAIPGWTTSE